MIDPRPALRAARTGVLLAPLVGALSACGSDPVPDLSPPAAATSDLAATEDAARRIEQDLAALLLEPLARGRLEEAERSIAAQGFRAELPTLGDSTDAGELRVSWVLPSGRSTSKAPAFLAALYGLNPTQGDPGRVECEVERIELGVDGTAATARLRLRWAGALTAESAIASRGDLTLYADARAVLEDDAGDWKLAAFVPAGRAARRPHALGAGVRIAGGPPRFVDRTRPVGLTFAPSPENQELLQAFIDRHRTLTLGGLSVCDVDGDNRPDLIATRSEELSLVFRNDGASGFVPEPLPITSRGDQPAFVLYVDLDGDGREEIVASEASRYEGAQAFAGLWTRTGAKEGSWRHLPRAFAMPNPVGMRRLAVQTVAPLDVDADGDLDLFFAVYGNALSRGDRYNTVEAYDGADNHLFINQGGLTFTEESEARGISGTGYSYVALAFDVDHDGDPDLFEGNDFGPNVLWRNDGGQFVADDRLGFDGVSAYTMGAALADLEADGRWDLYVSNMSSEEGMRMVPHAPSLSSGMRARVDTIARGNMLYSEGAPTVPWDQRGEALGIHEGEWGWGCQFVDIDGSGELSLAVTNGFASHRDRSLGDWQTFYWRQVLDDALRLERGEPSRNVNASERFRGSFNGHERDRLFVRTTGTEPERPWVDAAWMHGLDPSHDGRAVVPIDADGDGDLDLALWTLTGLVYQENMGAPTDWCRLRLVPKGGGVALGTRVMVTARGRTTARHVALVEGFQSQVTTDIHVGLGEPTGRPVDRIEVIWPNGETEAIEGAPSARLLTIQQGAGLVDARELPRWRYHQGGLAARRATGFGGGFGTGDGYDAAVELAKTARTPVALGLPPDLGLIVHVSETGEPSAEARSALTAVGRDARVVLARLRGASPETLSARDAANSIELDPELFASALGNAAESTIVYDGVGELLRVVRGAPDEAALRAFLSLARHERPSPHLLIEHGRLALEESRYREALALFTEAVRERTDLSVRDAAAFEGLGRAHVLLGRVDLAEGAYRRAIAVDPDYALGHFNLGVTLSHLERFDEAAECLLEARRIEGNSERVLGALLDATAAGGNAEGAREAGEALMGLVGESAATRVLLGKVEAREGRFEAALTHFDRALAVSPGNAEALAGRRKVRELMSPSRRSNED